MTRDQVVARARSMAQPGFTIEYKLGFGGMDPTKPSPGSRCDCSGFVAWCYGISRKLDHPHYREWNGGWLETSAVAKDARSSTGMFDEIPRELALPGDAVVFGDGPRGIRQGHIGIVTKVDKRGPILVCHCSAGNYKKYGHAIQETNLDVFWAFAAIVARPSWLEFRKT